jgi:quinol monooxygenase YgiN
VLIDVIASISVKPGCREKLLARFHANVPNVLAEDGCIHYYPTVDVDSGLTPQQKDENVVTIVEQWMSLDHLHAHLKAPHQAAYREDVKDWIEGVSLKILKKA